ncbi:MAG: toxin-antitoxin system YwqK family antitoxin [Vicingaceae bacterium]
MKNRIVVIFMLFSLAVFGQEENKTNAKGKQGVWKRYHKNGMLRYVGNFKDDKPVGEFKYYYDTGNIQRKITHKKDTSYSITFYNEGGHQSTGRYINQKKDSTWFYYDLDGYKIASDFYIKGLKNRISYAYYQSGKIAEEKAFFNDFENGKWIKYYENGKIKMEATHENGSLEGKVLFYSITGKRYVRGFYFHSTRDKVWLYFEADGNTIKKKEEYDKGKRIDANKDDDLETSPLVPISEDFLELDEYGMPRQ